MDNQGSNASQIATAIIAGLNFIFLIFFSRFGHLDRISERKHNETAREKDRNISVKLNWYHKIILDRSIDNIYAFFDIALEAVKHCEDSIIKALDTEMIVKEQLGKITSQKIYIEHSFVDLIRVLDLHMGQNTDLMLENFQDVFVAYLVDTSSGADNHTFDGCRTIVYEHKKIFLMELFNFETIKLLKGE